MSIAEFVSNLRKLDVRLSAEGQRLRVNAPKGVLTGSLRAQITARKQELLEFLRVNEPQNTLIPPPIQRRAIEGPAPLSFAQERLWFLEQLEPGSPVYNICRAFRLTGQLNVAALEASLTEILRRHEILRSQISIIDGRAMQIPAATAEFKLHFTDLRSLTGTSLDDEIRRRITAQGEQQFYLSGGLLLRGALLQTSNDQHILILTTHHIVADAWSMGILAGELWTLYDAYTDGRSTSLRELSIQYADYAVWQRERLQGETLEVQLSYWRKQLESLPVFSLPTNHPRPAKQSFRGARQLLSLPESLTKAVNELSAREGVTQFMTLLAAFQVLLYRYSGQEDVVVGSPIANRNRTEIEGLIGFFVNTLVLRTDLSEKPTFKGLLQRVRDACLGAYAHQDLPFEKLVEELRPERDLSRNPLFQVMFVLQNTPRPLPQSAGLSIERVDILPATSLFDLSLYLRERDGRLIGFFEYNTDLFEASTIERMIGHFETLLEGIVADPEQPISTLPLLTEAERHQLLVEWNNTESDYPKDVCIHELFEAQAAKTPEAIALEFEGKQLTYGELNRRANQLAHYLQGLGVGPEKLVGICVERSWEMVVSLLGILKTGGAYVPLDPTYPRERLEFMLNDSQCSSLVTQQSTIEDRGWRMEDGGSPPSILGSQMKVVCDSHWETISLESEQNIPSEVKPDNLAYVIYTSGSTGQPKGVAIEHRNTVAFLHWARSTFTPEELGGVLASTSICFDLSIFELFVPLSWGGKVILVENVLQLPRCSERHRVSLINTVPSAMTELLRINGLPESLRTVNLAGEPLRSELVEQIYGWRNVNKVYDLYGPSETTTYSTFTLRDSNQPATIGRPIANSRIYILDGSLEPVPVGVTGEIFVGGAGVARGYLNRSELTADMFIEDPFRGGQGDRLYRTGDLGRYLPDGNIEFLGRMDNQVKIRGYRIELGEIEAALTKYPTVKDCVVAALSDLKDETRKTESGIGKSGKELVAYIVSDDEQLKISELRNFLKQRLPEYMIPSSVVVLQALPLMPNGKVDRNRLPPPSGARSPLTGEFVPPRTEIEELIAQTWREVLKIENVGIYDNLFELGGHSLLATQIVARLQDAFNKNVPLRVLFDAPTVAELAEELQTIIREGRAPELPPIVPVPRDGPLPLSLNQEHLWHLDKMMPGTHFFNMPYLYRLSGELNVEALEKALREIIQRHDALRTVFAEIGGNPVQIVKPRVDFKLLVFDFRHADHEGRIRYATDRILEERMKSFDLAVGPLIRASLLRLSDTENLLSTTVHHIIADQWSMQVLRRELIALYIAFSRGQNSPLREPNIQFGDYAFWERRLLDEGLFNDQLAYWKNQLLPVVEPRNQVGQNDNIELFSQQFSHAAFEINEGLLERIRLIARREKCTTLTVLLAALVANFHISTGEKEIRIGTLVANRRQESEDSIGHFVNTVILRVCVSPGMGFNQLVGFVRNAILASHARQELPMEQLMRDLESKQGINRDSLFRMLLNYQKHDSMPVAGNGLTFAPWRVQGAHSATESLPTTFDSILNVYEASTTLRGTVNFREESFDNGLTWHGIGSFVEILPNLLSEPYESISRPLLRRYHRTYQKSE